jgi:phospholipase C
MSEWKEMAGELAARRIERRKFLRGALGVSALAFLESNKLAKAVVPRMALPDPTTSGLDTIVITLMENRSVDHYLSSWYPAVNAGDGFAISTASNPTKLATTGGCPTGEIAVADATAVKAFHLEQHCQMPDPDHGWDGSRVEHNYGRMNGFVERSGDVAMGYYREADIPFLAWLVREYTTFSRYHCSVMGPTFPNRLYAMSAQGGTARNNAIPTPPASDPRPTGYTWKTIFERLNEKNVSWAVYGSDVPQIALFFHLIYENPGKIRHITDYYVDAAAGLLPQVSFLDPAFFTYGNDDHPARDIKFGQRYISDAFLALADGPQWAKSAFVLSYDEHGGFFDHVPPPRVPDLRADANHCDDWGQLGFRVPTVIASPFSRRGFVDTSLYDHASILKMLEWRFGLDPLTPRDAVANNLADALDLSQTPRVDLATEPPKIALHPASVWCAQNNFSGPMHENGVDNPLEAAPDVPAPALTAKRIFEPVTEEVPHAELLAIADSGVLGSGDMRDRAKHGVWRD